MANTWETILRALATAGGFIAGLYGGWDGLMTVLVIFMVVALTGKSDKTEGGHFLSSVAFMGLLKKATIMLVVLLAVQLDKAVGDAAAMFQTAAVFFYLANEGLSIIENCGLLGVPVPNVLKNALEALRDKGDSGDKDDSDG